MSRPAGVLDFGHVYNTGVEIRGGEAARDSAHQASIRRSSGMY